MDLGHFPIVLGYNAFSHAVVGLVDVPFLAYHVVSILDICSIASGCLDMLVQVVDAPFHQCLQLGSESGVLLVPKCIWINRIRVRI